tara:strand:+ start:515 stop:784 length:270 start_codon:yes stop_codon:yes gene_type:complete
MSDFINPKLVTNKIVPDVHLGDTIKNNITNLREKISKKQYIDNTYLFKTYMLIINCEGIDSWENEGGCLITNGLRITSNKPPCRTLAKL